MTFARPLVAAAILAASALGLAGCYDSQALLLSMQQADRPLATGVFPMHGDRMQVELRPDGSYRVRDIGDRSSDVLRVVFNRLPGAGPARYAVGWSGRGVYVYGVASVQGRELAFAFPSCDDPTVRGIALRAGAKDSGRGIPRVCTFSSRAQLISALTRWADTQPLPSDAPRLPLAGRT